MVMPTFRLTFLLCRLLARTHQVYTALQRHRSILANGRPLRLLCGGVVAIDPLNSDLPQVVQTESTARGRPRRGTRHLCAEAGSKVPGRVVSGELEVGMLGRLFGTIVPVIHVEPAVDEGVVIVCRSLRIQDGVRGGLAILRARWAIRDGYPWLVGSNEVNGRYFRSETLVGRRVANDVRWFSCPVRRLAIMMKHSRVSSGRRSVIRKAEPVPVPTSPFVE